jgi:hypothetical protein
MPRSSQVAVKGRTTPTPTVGHALPRNDVRFQVQEVTFRADRIDGVQWSGCNVAGIVIFLHRYRLFYGRRRKCPGGVHVEHFSSRLSSHDDSGDSLIWIEMLASIMLFSMIVIFEFQTTRLNRLEDEAGFPHTILMVNLDLYTRNCSTSSTSIIYFLRFKI